MENSSTTYCNRFCSELNPCGRAKDGLFTTIDPATGRIIDIPESFAPSATSTRYFIILFWKFAIFVLGWSAVGQAIADCNQSIFYLAYASNWAATMCCCYLSINLVNFFSCRNQIVQPTDTAKISWRIFVTWVSFIIGIQFTGLATVLYWMMSFFDPSSVQPSYFINIIHGGLLIFLT